MGCAGSIDQQVIQQEISNKATNGPQAKCNIKVCNINIGQFTCPFQYFLKRNMKFEKKNKPMQSSSDQQQYQQNSQKLDQQRRLQKQQKMLNKKYEKIVKWVYGKSLNIQVKYYEQKDYRQKVQNILKINKLTTKNNFLRYTPLYDRKSGIKIQSDSLDNMQGRILMDQDQFITKWYQIFVKLINDQNNTKLKQQLQEIQRKHDSQYVQSLIKQIQQFDLICYHTIVSYVYKIKIIRKQLKNKQQQFDQQGRLIMNDIKLINYKQQSKKHLKSIKQRFLAYDYSLFLKSKFDNSLFNLQQKINKIKKFIQIYKFDIIFMQEVSQQGLKQIRKKLGYYLITYSKNLTTIILINQSILDKLQINKQNITLAGHNFIYIKDQQQQYKQYKQYKQLSLLKKDSIIVKKYRDLDSNKKKLNKIQQKQQTLSSQHLVNNIISSIIQNSQLKHLIKKNKTLQKQKSKLIIENTGKQFRQQFYFGDQSVIQFVGQLILISAYFKDFITNKAMKSLQKDLQTYRRKFPKHTIIIGFNSSFTKKNNYDKTNDKMELFRKNLIKDSQSQDEIQQQSKKPIKLYFVPDIYQAVPGIFDGQKCVVDGRKLKKLAYNKGLFTTFRKKSYFCLSYFESCQQYMGVDSFILSTNKINKDVVRDCDGNKIDQKCNFYKQQQYLPSLYHPFTDFFVCGEIDLQIQPQINNKMRQQIRKQYNYQKLEKIESTYDNTNNNNRQKSPKMLESKVNHIRIEQLNYKNKQNKK